MIFSHLILFAISYLLIIELFQKQSRKFRFFVQIVVFFFIALDATVVGYFHTLLTEYVAATIAVVSSFIALKLYKSQLFSKQFYWWSIYFLAMVPASWHLKQPYIGAAYFPFIICCVLIIFRKFSKKSLIYGLITNLILITLVMISTFAWNGFLISEENPMRKERQFSTMLEGRLDKNFGIFRKPLIESGKDLIEKYLVSINFFLYDRSNNVIVYEPCLTCGFQNIIIGQRMFYMDGKTNTFHSPPYDKYTYYYRTNYNTPFWLTGIYQSTSKFSNFLFTITNLLIPFFFIVFVLNWIRRKNIINSALILLSGTSLLNSIAHILALGYTLDRYLFWTYPLNLLIIAILWINFVVHIVRKVSKRLPVQSN
jgi:hypothetical protein